MWDKRWMALAEHIASWSKDKSRKAAAVIVDERNVLVSMGWNGFPRGLDDEVLCRHERPAKYLWTEHAERNAIYNAAANGFRLMGCRMYLPWFPCADCARAIVQAGIKEVICAEPDWEDPTYKGDFAVTREMFHESGVRITFAGWVKSPKRRV
jgi:dCMP deaminase